MNPDKTVSPLRLLSRQRQPLHRLNGFGEAHIRPEQVCNGSKLILLWDSDWSWPALPVQSAVHPFPRTPYASNSLGLIDGWFLGDPS